MDIPDTTSTTALVAAVAALGAVYYQRAQMRLQQGQVSLAERELNDRVQSLASVVQKLEEERKSRERAIEAERQLRLAAENRASDTFISSTLAFAGFAAFWQYHVALCVALLSRNVQAIATQDSAIAAEVNAVKDLAASLVLVQITFNQLTEAYGQGDIELQQNLDRMKTAGEILAVSVKQLSPFLPEASLPPPDLSLILDNLVRRKQTVARHELSNS